MERDPVRRLEAEGLGGPEAGKGLERVLGLIVLQILKAERVKKARVIRQQGDHAAQILRTERRVFRQQGAGDRLAAQAALDLAETGICLRHGAGLEDIPQRIHAHRHAHLSAPTLPRPADTLDRPAAASRAAASCMALSGIASWPCAQRT